MTTFNAPMFTDEDKAREALEVLRWPDGPYCPHCGNSDQTKVAKIEGAKHSHRPGLYYCNECKGQFTVTVGTVFERSKVPLTKWWFAAHLLNSSKKGVSAHQIHRTIGVTYKTAWFMMHRLREAMADLKPAGPMGGPDKIVEADTTFIGGKESNKHKSKRNSKNIGGKGKQIVHTLVERDGSARSHHVASISGEELRPILTANVSRKSSLMTDTAGGYMGVGKEFARHEMVDHGIGEYVRGDAYSNTVEGYFSILKRGITGVYHHVSEAHLKRYLAEFDFRYSNRSSLGVTDGERTAKALKGIEGKRLTYRPTN
ncbi:IS1595 family transposase [Bradyrhizobium sp.]|uniref:IS1595 family transposase n=1 Tax=Bradyrhizobium sp. TaxID=376 RepID=UPI002718D741|nr:IS1595 family transposase [Bradyrhizobium sp.]MDO9296533.1 IS1595 family transposase [Bradyrhizobium sp.]